MNASLTLRTMKKLWPIMLLLMVMSAALAAPLLQQPHATLSALHEEEGLRAVLYAEGISEEEPIAITLTDETGRLYILPATRTGETTWQATFPLRPASAKLTAQQGTSIIATIQTSATIAPAPQPTITKTTLKDSKGKEIAASISITDSAGRRSAIPTDLYIELPSGRYDVTIIPEDARLPIKALAFRELAIKEEMELGIEPLEDERFVQAYAIDPTALNFTEATVTATAKGKTLYKCAAWNFTAQTCEGTWEIYKTGLAPGEAYTFTITATDPAFGEADVESEPDTCVFSDDAGYGDSDTNVNCLTEVLTQDGGFAADMDDLETTGAGNQAIMDLSFTNNLYAQSVNSVSVTFRYQRQTNTNVGATTTYIQVLDGGSYVTACTDTVTINAWETYTCDLSSRITTEAELNNISIRLITDTAKSGPASQAGKTFVDLAYISASYVARDVTPPKYSSLTVSPSSPTTYTGTPSWFNVTWNDDFNMSSAVIEHNFTGVGLVNTSMSNASSIYYYSKALAAGSYVWRSYGTDTSGLTNKTSQYAYVVNKATPSLALTFNGTSDNITINDSALINITGIGGEGTLEIIRNGTVITTGTGRVSSLQTFSSFGDEIVTLRHNATQNYTARSISYTITVTDTIPPGVVTNLQNVSRDSTWITWTWNNPSDTDFSHVEIWLNGTFKENSTSETYNATALMVDTLYELEVRSVDVHNVKSAFVNDTARTLTSTDTTPPIISNLQHTDITASSATISWQTDELATCLVTWGTASGVYTDNATCAQARLNQSILLSSLQPSDTYYYRVTATDLASNDALSPERSFTTLPDTTAPKWSAISVWPASPITYSPTTTTWFNVTWTDDVMVQSAVIEHNFTGSMQNTSMSNASSTYYYASTIGGGSYVWRGYATDGSNTNKTAQYAYVVNKADSTIALYLDGLESNNSVAQDSTITIDGAMVTPATGYLYLYYAGSLVGQGNDDVEYTAAFGTPGTYNVTLNYLGDGNYLSSTKTYWLTINDTVAPNVTLTAPAPGHNDTDGVVVFTYNVQDEGTLANCSLLIDGSIEQTNSTPVKGSNSFTKTDFEDGTYSWNVRCADTAGNSATGEARTIIIDKQTITINVPATTTSNWDDADAISIAAINATGGTTESRTIARNTQRYIVWTNYTTANIPPGAVIMDADFRAYHTGTTRTTFQGVEWYNGATYAGTGCSPVTQTGVYRTDSCDLSSYVDTIDEANDISLRYIVSATTQQGTITIDYLYVTLVYIKETTPPTLTNIYNVTLDIGEPLAAQYNATDLYGITHWTVNDTRFSINDQGLLTNTTSLSTGEYSILISAYDPSDNYISAPVTITVQDVIDITISMDTSGLGKTIQLYNSTGELISSGASSLSETLLAGLLYNVRFSSTLTSGQLITTVYDVNLTQDVTFTSDITETYSGPLPAYIPEISPVYALDTQSAPFSHAQITIPKAGLDVEYILHCTDWNAITDTCNAWEANETSTYDYTENSTHFTINVTEFDAFGGGPGDTLPNITSISVYDVTGQADTHSGGTLINSGTNTTFNIREGREYRAEFLIRNEGRKWTIVAADVAKHAGLNASWTIDTANDIWYGIAGTNRTGGTFSSGTVTWDLSAGGTLDTNSQGTWYYVFNVITLPERFYGVSFTVNDTSKASGSTDKSTYHLLYERELVVNESSIGFSDTTPEEGQNVTIAMSVFNIGVENATSFIIELWDATLGEQVYNKTITVEAQSSALVQYNWTATTGPHLFELRADTPLATNGTIHEAFEDNNNYSKRLDVGAWQTLYGDVFEQTVLAGQSGTFYAWPRQGVVAGNLYVADSDATITWQNVQALTRDKDNNSASADLGEADAALNMLDYTDSITARYGLDNSTPKETKSFTVYGRTIANVPVIDSTTTDSFQTGILWDTTADTGDGEFDGSEALIFLTAITPDALGTYGTYDYELTFPASLQRTFAGSDTAYLYLEIT